MIIIIYIVIIIAVIIFRNYYFKRPIVQQRQQAKAKLALWIKEIEMLIWVILWLPLMYALWKLEDYIHFYFHPAMPILGNYHSGGPAILEGVSIFVILILGCIVAMVLANGISWLIPAMRKGNNENKEKHGGLGYRKGTMQLLWIMLPLVVVYLIVAII